MYVADFLPMCIGEISGEDFGAVTRFAFGGRRSRLSGNRRREEP